MTDEDGCLGEVQLPEGYIMIKKTRFDELIQSEKELMRLDDAGVDNWEWNYMRYRNEDGEFDEDYDPNYEGPDE